MEAAEHHDLVDELLYRATDDWLMAAEVTSAIVEEGPRSPEEVRPLALTAIRSALRAGLLLPGGIEGDRFVAWGGTPSEWIARIETEWPANRYPELGEVCWFNLTESGLRRGNEIVAERLGPDAV